MSKDRIPQGLTEEYYIPPSLKGKHVIGGDYAEQLYTKFATEAWKVFEALIDSGVPALDAAYILPRAYRIKE